MRAITIFLAALLLFGSYAFCSTSREGAKISMDEIYKKSILGQWSEGESPYAIASFEPGGIYQGWLYESPKKERLLHFIKGKWWIEDGKLYNSATEISPPVPSINLNEIIIDKIVAITEDSMTLIDDELIQYTKRKVK